MIVGQVVGLVLFAIGMLGIGNEFAWHSWQAISRRRLFNPQNGLGGSFYSLTCIIFAIAIWGLVGCLPPIWILLGCIALMPAIFFLLRFGAFGTWRIFDIDTRFTSIVDDLRGDVTSNRLLIEDAVDRLQVLAEKNNDYRLRQYIVKSIGGLLHPRALVALRDFLKDQNVQVQLAAMISIKCLSSRLRAKNNFPIDEAHKILAELQVVLSNPNCDSRLSGIGNELRDIFRRTFEYKEYTDSQSITGERE